MKQILLTGFELFHKTTSNFSQEIVRAIESYKFHGIHTAVLAVEFDRSSKILIKQIEELKLNQVISLRQTEGQSQITPEKIAVNLDGDSPNAVEIGKIASNINSKKGSPSNHLAILLTIS